MYQIRSASSTPYEKSKYMADGVTGCTKLYQIGLGIYIRPTLLFEAISNLART